jgi:hypothetical protein
MNLLMAVHKAIDFFFCDRCPVEVMDGCKSIILGEYLCPFAALWDWDILPEEPLDVNHPIYWPRSWLGKVLPDQGKQEQGGIR